MIKIKATQIGFYRLWWRNTTMHYSQLPQFTPLMAKRVFFRRLKTLKNV